MSAIVEPRNEQTAADSYSAHMQRIGQLVQQLEVAGDGRTRDLARQLTQSLLDVHRCGLAKLWNTIEQATESNAQLREECLNDPLVSNLLVLHELHPVDLATRVGQALDKAQPKLAAHAGQVQVVGITSDSELQLRMICRGGCRSTIQSMKQLVENALYETAADITSISWEPEESPGQGKGFVSIDSLTHG